jgi:diguanylate cyclase (GGDEF)-like protein
MTATLNTKTNSNMTSQKTTDALSRIIEQGMEANAQLKLTTLLQTTIEIEPLFELFFGQIQHLLKLQSCQFENDEKSIVIKLGNPGAHTCHYSLTIQQQHLGNITFSRRQRFSNEELAQLESLLGTLVYPLRNALNYRDAINQALSDPLTGLGNRGALEQSLDHQWHMAQRYEQDLGILMVDIDHFKSINDTFGHDTGDYVIKKVAEVINATTRQTDLAFRYGGEEFLVLLTKNSPFGSNIIAERIRENIESMQLVDSQGRQIKVTVSVGGTQLRPGVDKQTLVKEADNALYKAKTSGRNRVEFHLDETTVDRQGHLSI